MKKILFSILALATVNIANAQTPFALSGTAYTQTFDNISSGLPQGWRVDTIVNVNAGLGNNAFNRFSTTPTSWGTIERGFKNIASADGLTAGAAPAAQLASTDRALGIRQVSSSGWDDKDSLVSASFNIANTVGLSNFNLTVKMQSLHTAAKRYHNWIVQYGIGATPATFTTITTTPAIVTIDSNFSNTTVTVNFGAALDNQAMPVWIRLMPSDTTMGGGNRPFIGIDDFELTWTGTAVNNTPQVLTYVPASGSFNVPTSTTTLAINFDKNITIGTGNVTINNITDVTNQIISAASCTVAGMNVTIPGVTLLAGKQYAVQYDSTCFKNGTYSCYGVYNNSTWIFNTQPPVLPPVTSLNETFTGCNAPLLGLFMEFSVTGAQTWRCSNFGRNDTDAVYMNGYAGSSLDNEDWLISPPLDMSAMANPNLHFWSKIRFVGNNSKEVYVSSNFMGDPNTATWINLNPALGTLDTTWKFYNNLNLTSYKATPFNIGFKYVSVSTGTADEWSIDDVYITDGPVGVQTFEQAGLNVVVLGQATDKLNLQIMDTKRQDFVLSILDINGKVILSQNLKTLLGKNNYSFTIPGIANGLYILNLKNDQVNGHLKFVKQ